MEEISAVHDREKIDELGSNVMRQESGVRSKMETLPSVDVKLEAARKLDVEVTRVVVQRKRCEGEAPLGKGEPETFERARKAGSEDIDGVMGIADEDSVEGAACASGEANGREGRSSDGERFLM